MGHCFEFVLADFITGYYRNKLGANNVFFNVGLDEHGQKVQMKAEELGYENTQQFCDQMADKWKLFCNVFNISYNSLYRTSDIEHKLNVQRFYKSFIEEYTYTKPYSGKYCVGCESFKTDKEIENNKCIIHQTELTDISETNTFFDLNKFKANIQDVLIDKLLNAELGNLLKEPFELSITRKNVQWGIPVPDNDGSVFYVWFDALLNYLFAIRYFSDPEFFHSFWSNSIQICGKDNLKFQAYIFQSFLIAANIPQTKEILVHGLILDEQGLKMSKTTGNVIDPIEQINKWGLLPLRYYLIFGLNTFKDSKYSEIALVELWTNNIVNGLGNTISRVLHMVDQREVKIEFKPFNSYYKQKTKKQFEAEFEAYNFHGIRDLLNQNIASINSTISEKKPYSKDCVHYNEILNDLYWELESIIWVYKIVFKEMADDFDAAFQNKKKVILFKHITKSDNG